MKGSVKEEYTEIRTIWYDNDEGSVTCWPEEIEYLLRTKEKLGQIWEGILTMRDTSQKQTENEKNF